MPLNFGHSTVVTPPSPATSGLSFTVATGTGARFEAGPVVLCPEGQDPTPSNAEIATVLSKSGDTITLSARAVEGTTARTVTAGWRVLQGVTAALWDALERDDLVGDLLTASSTFYVAHRGGGDEAPEHTLRAYLQSLSRNIASGIEVSAQTTVDGVPVCMHDTGAGSLARTTTLTGELGALPLSAIDGLIVDSAVTDTSNYALGAGATTLDRIPLLGEVLSHLAHKTTIWLEPKTSYLSILQAINWIPEPGKTIVWKVFRSGTTNAPTSATLAAARGIRSWIYLNDDDTDQVFTDTLTYADMVGIPLTATDSRISSLVALAHAAGKQVIVHPVRRRSEVTRLEGLGVDGMMCTNPSYAGTAVAHATSWPLSAGIRLPGDFWALESRQGTFTPANSELLLGQGSNGGIVCGSMCPVANAAGAGNGYRISFDMKWVTLPVTSTTHSDIYFGHASDEPFIFQATTNQPGYHAFIRADGTLGLNTHTNGTGTGTSLGTASSATPVANTYMSFQVDVTSTGVTFRRTDGTPVAVTSSNTANRGGYFGFNGGSASVAPTIRNVAVTQL